MMEMLTWILSAQDKPVLQTGDMGCLPTKLFKTPGPCVT